MEQTIQLKLPGELALWANQLAAITHRDLEGILIDWLRLGLEGIVETLSDDEVVTLANLKMDQAQSDELSGLLAQQREREITADGRTRLRELLDIYEFGMLWKAEGLKVAVQRGLLPPMHS